MDSHLIRSFDHLKRVPRMPRLSAATTTGLPPQIARAGLLQTIAAGWLAAIPAVLDRLISQGLDHECLLIHDLLQLSHLLLQCQDHRDEGLLAQLLKLAPVVLSGCHHSSQKYTIGALVLRLNFIRIT